VIPEELHILQHSLGVDKYGRGEQYRNHFVTGPGTTDWPHCHSLAGQGLMINHGPRALCNGDHLFTVSEAGKSRMAMESPQPPKPHKLTRSQNRYREFLRAETGHSFAGWIGDGRKMSVT
jgi:hypothetical protein